MCNHQLDVAERSHARTRRERWWDDGRIARLIELRLQDPPVSFAGIAADMGTTRGTVSGMVLRLQQQKRLPLAERVR